MAWSNAIEFDHMGSPHLATTCQLYPRGTVTVSRLLASTASKPIRRAAARAESGARPVAPMTNAAALNATPGQGSRGVRSPSRQALRNLFDPCAGRSFHRTRRMRRGPSGTAIIISRICFSQLHRNKRWTRISGCPGPSSPGIPGAARFHGNGPLRLHYRCSGGVSTDAGCCERCRISDRSATTMRMRRPRTIGRYHSGEVETLARKVLGEPVVTRVGVSFHALRAGDARARLPDGTVGVAGHPLPGHGLDELGDAEAAV